MRYGSEDEFHVRIRPLGPDGAPDLQAVFERAGDYFMRVTGSAAPAMDAAERELSSVASTPGREVALIVISDAAAPAEADSSAESASPPRAAAERPVGAIGWWAGYPEPDLALLGMVMVAREDRGRGFARAALRRLEDRLREGGITRLRTAVGAGDAESQGFVEALGFESMDQRARVDVDSGRMRIAFFEKSL